jgi:hypothetical protein
MGIAFGSARLILRKRDDAFADGFTSRRRLRETHSSLTDECFGHHCRFDNLRPCVWLQGREPFTCLADLVVAQGEAMVSSCWVLFVPHF